MHVFSQNTVNHVKYVISDMLCCESVANSGVFATLAFLVVAKTS